MKKPFIPDLAGDDDSYSSKEKVVARRRSSGTGSKGKVDQAASGGGIFTGDRDAARCVG